MQSHQTLLADCQKLQLTHENLIKQMHNNFHFGIILFSLKFFIMSPNYEKITIGATYFIPITKNPYAFWTTSNVITLGSEKKSMSLESEV